MSHLQDAIELMDLPDLASSLSDGEDFLMMDNLADTLATTGCIAPCGDEFKQKIQHPFVIHFTSFLLCVSGSFTLKLNTKVCHLKAGTLLIIRDGTRGEYLDLSEDARLVVMAFSKRLRLPGSFKLPTKEILSATYQHPIIHLSSEELEDLLALYKLLRHSIGQPDFSAKRELFISGINTFSFYVSEHFKEITDNTPSHAAGVFQQFISLVEEHYDHHHDLAFYADKLCITPKYMSRLVREVSGVSAKEWILDRLMLEAKILLSQSRYTVREVSHQLGFPNPSFFGTAFKKATGQTPMAYGKTSENNK